MPGSQSRPPISLRIIAGLFLLGAVSSLAGIILALLEPRLDINFGVLGFWIARGLLRGDPTWRRWAMVFSAIAIVTVVLGSAAVLWGGAPVTAKVLHLRFDDLPKWAWLAVAVPAGVVSAWTLWVLTRREIRARFERPDEPADKIAESPPSLGVRQPHG